MMKNKDNKKGGTLHHRANRQAPSKGTENNNIKLDPVCQIEKLVDAIKTAYTQTIKKTYGETSPDFKNATDGAFSIIKNLLPPMIVEALR